MRRTAWLISLCWQLPEGAPIRQRLQRVLLERFDVSASNRVANDTTEVRPIRIAPTSYLLSRLRPVG